MNEVRLEEDWLVACLCAQWCGSCRDYRATFTQAAGVHPSLRFVWVDIEDEADALAPFDVDIENFPTLLVAQGEALRFFGVLTPHAATLKRTIEAAQSAPQPSMPVADASGLIRRLREVGSEVI